MTEQVAETTVGSESHENANMEVSALKLGAFGVLPDALLCHIGKMVYELCGVEGLFHFARASKHIHSTLVDTKIISSIIESENEKNARIFELENQKKFERGFPIYPIFLENEIISKILRSEHERIFDFMETCGGKEITQDLIWKNLRAENKKNFIDGINLNPSVTVSSSIEELALCDAVIRAEKHRRMGLIMHGERQLLKFIAATLEKHPKALAIVDYRDGPGYSPVALERGILKFGRKYRQVNGKRSDQERRVLFRSCVSEPQIPFNRPSWFFWKVGFRLNGIEVPPLRCSKRYLVGSISREIQTSK